MVAEERTCKDIITPRAKGVREYAFLRLREEVLLVVKAWRIGSDEDGFGLQAG